ncbi:MAG TPA: glycosyltransferase [Rhizomicrobium sp.]|jgi:hopene-associated glycosyltransferase HpnB|nr:glycosyltransferase [Rhizomicrobium sp.]
MIVLAAVPLAIWIYLLLGRGMFWQMRERDDDCTPRANAERWPAVCIVVPARDEADVIGRAVESLLTQDYQGFFHIVLVDDRSSDGTAEAARRAALACGMGDRMEIISGQERPSGWTGKVWAMRQGFARAQLFGTPDYLLFTDADIAHTPDNLRCLVSRAEAGRLVLVSLMAKLHCESFAEKLLIPAFVFFFAMLFPFGWANDAARRPAAAAGGCMLVRRDALAAAGGLEAIAREIIDDCALARILKRRGPIWLGLTRRALSIRPYGGMGEIGRMVARSAFAQLHYSPVLLCGTVAGMVIVYAAPPLLALFAPTPARIMGAVGWLLMGLAYQPMLRFYRLSPLWGAALPAIGALYAGFTVNSAVQHWRGRGGMWKGRAQALA